MKVSVNDVSACRRSLSVDLPPDVVEAAYEDACRDFARRVKLDGFRQGKVPRRIVEQRYGREIEQEVVEHLIRKYSEKAIDETGLHPLHAPVLKDYKFGRATGLTFEAEFEIRPKVTVSGYKGLKAARREVSVTEMDVQKALDDLRERRARYEPVEGRGIEAGDHALMDLNGAVEGHEDHPFTHDDVFFEIGSAGPHPELTDELRGMKPGEERTFGVRYPQDHPATDVAGKRVVYRVKLKEIKTKRLPVLDDDFAKETGSAEGLEALRAGVREELRQMGVARERSEARRQIMDQLVEANASIDVPESMIDDQVEAMIEDVARSMVAQGMDPREARVDWDEMRREQRPAAKRYVLGGLLLDAIAEQEQTKAEPSEVDAVLEREAARRKQSVDALRARWDKEGRTDALKRQILREKVLDFLLGPANTLGRQGEP